MRKKDLLYALTLTLMLGACGTKNNKEQTQNDTLDTVCVLGVTPSILIKKFDYVNKKGEVFRCSMKTVVDKGNGVTDAAYIERGDTVILRNNKIVKNITLENLAHRYINGR